MRANVNCMLNGIQIKFCPCTSLGTLLCIQTTVNTGTWRIHLGHWTSFELGTGLSHTLIYLINLRSSTYLIHAQSAYIIMMNITVASRLMLCSIYSLRLVGCLFMMCQIKQVLSVMSKTLILIQTFFWGFKVKSVILVLYLEVLIQYNIL